MVTDVVEIVVQRKHTPKFPNSQSSKSQSAQIHNNENVNNNNNIVDQSINQLQFVQSFRLDDRCTQYIVQYIVWCIVQCSDQKIVNRDQNMNHETKPKIQCENEK